ncbi:MAG: Holliday junction resolvase [Thermoplasmatales archaeon]|nr:Holliday junction resolvase [Thermoplasmatales archaeon]
MAPPGDIYERELKSLLSGEEKTIVKMVKTCSESERASYESVIGRPFVVVRAAGSLGIDLVALRGDFSFPIEVKSSSEDTIHFSRSARMTEQADALREECRRSGLLPLYAYRLKRVRGDPWRIFSIPIDEELKGALGLLQRRVPPMDVSGNGNYIMRWESGIKLSELLGFMEFCGE